MNFAIRISVILTLAFGSGFARAETNRNSKLLRKDYSKEIKYPRADGIPKNDCSEKDLTQEKFLGDLSNAKTTTLETYLKNLEPDTLQNFTLVYDSKSPEHEGVTTKFPRVIRWSKDGKITLAYTCDPNSPSYGKVQAQIFDDQTRTFQFVERGFPNKSRTSFFDAHPKDCGKCHGGDSPRPNWGQYQHWEGVFGSFDDDLLDYDFKGFNERKEFYAFKELQKNNPCYSSLPWGNLKKIPPTFPYRENAFEGTHGEYRPNLRFLAAETRLVAKKLSAKIESSENFKKIKYYLLMEAAGCDFTTQQKQSLKKFLGNYYIEPKPGETGGDSESANRVKDNAPFLYGYAQSIGLQATDFSLEMNTKNPDFYTGDQAMVVIAGGEMLRSVATSETDLKEFVHLDHSNADYFGTPYSCLDDLGGGIDLSTEKTDLLCSKLNDKIDRKIELKIPEKTTALSPATEPCTPAQNTGPVVITNLGSSLSSIQKALFVSPQKCQSCHQNEYEPNDFKQTKLYQMGKEKFIDLLKKRLDSKDEAVKMPRGKTLMGGERESIIQYFEDLFN